MGELNKCVERVKEELARLHYKDEKVFPFEKYVTKLKENFYVLEKDRHEDLTGKQQEVNVLQYGIRSTDPCIMSAKVNIFQSFRGQFDKAAEFMSSLIANMHAAAQLDYANRHGNKRRYVSAMGLNDQRGGRGRARQGGRSGQCGGRGDGRGRRRNNERRTYANNVDITDPHRNFTSDEWEQLGTMRSYVLQLREGGRGGRDRGDRNQTNSTNRTVGSATATNNTTTNDNASNNVPTDQSVVSEITERGSQNGRGFLDRGTYNNA